MKLLNADGTHSHLSYCSNIHPGESWEQVRTNLTRFVPGISEAVNPGDPFGIGLRLSAAATADLAQPDVLSEFKQFLNEHGLYVFTLNGFPYGPFHGTRVKEDVYLPDWQDTERVRYTNQLADVFSQFLPDDQTGSISTVPGAFKARVTNDDQIRQMMHNMVEHVAHLVKLERTTGRSIVLAIEPEPCCYIETIDESCAFFRDWLFGAEATERLGKAAGLNTSQAQRALHKHLTLCLDLCHAAVEFENYTHCTDKLKACEITVGKLQISSGLRLTNVTPQTAQLLEPFDDDVYLHQVVEQVDGQLNRYTDLPDAFAALKTQATGQREWRVHFHVPIFLDTLADFSSTQYFVKEALVEHKRNPISAHLEVETYTWNVLPEQYRTQAIDAAIVREINWLRDVLAA